jgi:hypothetical protein
MIHGMNRYAPLAAIFLTAFAGVVSAQIVTTGVPWWLPSPNMFQISTGPNPCGSVQQTHDVSIASDDTSVRMYYLCTDGREFLKEWPQGDSVPPESAIPGPIKESELSRIQCVAGMVPTRDGTFCVVKNHPLALR